MQGTLVHVLRARVMLPHAMVLVGMHAHHFVATLALHATRVHRTVPGVVPITSHHAPHPATLSPPLHATTTAPRFSVWA